MKRCPTCNKIFTDPSLSFCIDDGTPLIPASEPTDETTVVLPSSRAAAGNSASDVYKPRDWQPSDYQPPGFQVPPGSVRKRSAWPWVVGILAAVILGLAGLGIAVAFIVPNMLRAASNQNRTASNENSSIANVDDTNSNSKANATGSNSEIDEGDQKKSGTDDDVVTPPPTDEATVLADLTKLEHEWTVANINADKNALNRILADDYVGKLSDGQSQGKAEYLQTIKRDTEIQKWDFEDLNVSLRGNRASLSGALKLQYPGGQAAYRFTDKFVWRDGRWQAVSSDVSRIE